MRGLVTQRFSLLFPPLDPLPEPGDTRLEVSPVDQALSIAIDQSPHAAAQLGELGLDASEVGRSRISGLDHTPLVFHCNQARILQHPLDLTPHGFVQPICAHLWVIAQALPAETVGVAAAAAIIGIVAPFPFG